MSFAARISSNFTSSTRRQAIRRSLTALGVFVAVGGLVVGCSDQLPTSAQKSIGSPRLNLSSNEGTRLGTDKQDYWPGETVVIEGWEWTPGENVRLQIVHVDSLGDNTASNHQPWVVAADDQGNVNSSWEIAVDGDEGGATLLLTADGEISGAHAEVQFTDLTGTVNLFAEVGRTNSQNAFQWNSTVYPRVQNAGANTCYRLRWTDPATAVTTTTHLNVSAGTLDPTGKAVGEQSGTWTLVVDQKAGADCANETGYTSAANPIFFDVARAVIVGAGTSGTTDSPGGDQCVYQTNNVASICQNSASPTMFVRHQASDDIRSYVRFDLSTASPAIPAGVIVTDAKVRLSVAGTVSSRTYRIQRADATWAEGTVTWANQSGATGATNDQAMASALVIGAGGGDPQTWVKWDVDADVQGYLSSTFTNYGWRISDVSATTTSSAGRFHTTENTTGCASGVTLANCKRTWPVLLIDYSDPPKLEFYTSVKSGVVGQCLGPIQVQSKDFSGAVLAVGSDVTVNLSTANLGVGDIFSTAGAGSFYSNNDCSTGTTTTTISTGNSISSSFYYRATHRGDGGHDVVASATGYTPDPSQTETINKAITNTTYDGDLIVIPGSTFTMKATLTSTYAGCEYGGSTTPYGRRVLFRFDPNPETNLTGSNLSFPFTFTNSSGVAQRTTSTTGWVEGIYDLTVNAIDNDDCTAQKAVPDPVIAVLSPGNAATGGGFLAGSKVAGGRANFGFNVRPIEGSDPVAYKGQFLLMRQDGNVPSFRCKGPITFYGVVSGSTPLRNFATGTCDFQVWNAALNGGEGGWQVPDGSYTNRPFTIEFIDNGTGTKGKLAPPPDEFGFSISFAAGPDDPSFARNTLNGGNIDVKTGGSTTTTTTGGTGGGGGKRK